MPRAVHLLVFEGFADWEPAFALAELRRSGGFDVYTIGFTEAPVRSMGGLPVVPDFTLAGLEPAQTCLLLLPGGELWLGDYPTEPLHETLHRLHARGVPIAAICAATVALARAELLKGRRHTSNGPGYLPARAPGCTDPADYAEALSVRDRGLITANGLGAIEFARDILAELEVFDAQALADWYACFKRGHAAAMP